ncbi:MULTISPECIES: universal stress protein [Leuconostoc]|jgi:nucleotide-binding universal stress UspA family protein|uniref:Universal stress protein n=1 Tax=Leuconostoc pseudomesenteroides TaxID=33968 RepID=A0A5B8SYE8_LEUPS|nr:MULTISPECIES: universal stress protein [Leuconostoc]MBK0041038.1 universal stress protein [Leuconostoc sp. S51]MBK0051987.1 universal stress protein [Leuconostoc sp. S50]MBS0957982.1 universal stress protein [Leuconostoc pseudomesenteroides]MCC8440001.1 universal stress protein [Leuconostoc pseudomesenteroides]MCT4380170.1 universal stress protein [Leuconostoc pseudomesenteroides]
MSELNLNIEPMQFKNILVGVDESQQGYFALANAIHQASEDGSKLTIATVLEMGDLSTIDALHLDFIKEKRAEFEANLEKYRAYAVSKGAVNVETIFADGAKAGEVLVQDIAPRVGADLIIVGAHSREGFWGSLGSQAAYVARHAKISSMVARHDS